MFHLLWPPVFWQAAQALAIRPQEKPPPQGWSRCVSQRGAWVRVVGMGSVSFVLFLQEAVSVWTYCFRELERRVSNEDGVQPPASQRLKPCAW